MAPSPRGDQPSRGGTATVYLAASHPGIAPVPLRVPDIRPMPLSLVLGILLTSLLLQRFALPIGNFAFSVEMPIGFALGAWGLLTGNLEVDRRRFVLLLGLAAVGLLATAIGINLQTPIARSPSLASLANWLAITAFAALTFRWAAPEERFFKLVNSCLAGIALAGVVQFMAQFAGFSLFSFGGFVPQTFLMETGFFNTANPMAYGSNIMRSNGFFLVEPSVFSQFMALAVIIEILYFRRIVFLALYFAGLLVSVSGTGWLVLIAFLAAQMVGAGRRGVVLGLSLAGAAAAALIIFALVVPEAAAVLLSRVDEFQYDGTSGHERFVGPFLALRDVLAAAPWAGLIGIGPGTSEHLQVPYGYAMNSPGKVLIEYGILGLVLYFALLVSAERTRRQRALLVPVLVLLMFAGNWCQFPPVLFPVLLINNISRFAEGTASLAPSRR